MYIYYVTRVDWVDCCLWISICKYSYTYNLYHIVEHVTYRNFFPLFYSPPSFLAPYPLNKSGLSANKFRVFAPPKWSTGVMLQDEVNTSKRGLCCTCSTLKNMQDHRQYFLDHLHQTQSGELAKKWRFLCAKRHVRMFRAMLFIIANKTKQWQLKKKTGSNPHDREQENG